jgi:trimeric autotransporter adhesin
VTRTPVATGADLVAYSGFSASNNFLQPNNSDLNFGTGDFCFAAWINTTNITAGSRYICSRDGQILFGYSSTDGGVIFTSGGTQAARAQRTTKGWTCLVGVRDSGFLKIYTNGVLSGTSQASTFDVTSATARLGVGGFWTGSAWSQMIGNASIALLRISATVPTASQIAKIYNDEKFLFQDNAQATLYGASDAVTALAHDPVTDLLHVGTSAGRSVFSGLRRVSNTTTAVGTAISASNSLVVEE